MKRLATGLSRDRGVLFGKRSRRGTKTAGNFAVETLESRMLLAGDSLASAYELGVVPATGNVHPNGVVSTAVPAQFYKFEIAAIRDITVSVGSGATVQLIDDYNHNNIVDSGDVVSQVNQGSLHQRLSAGTYFAEVTPYYSNNTSYTLTVASAVAPADPGSTLATGLDLGTLNSTGTITHDDWVGNFDGLDVYKFTIPAIRDVSLSVGAGATVQLVDDYNQNLQVDSGDVVTQVSQGTLHQRLAAGSYYALVSPYYSSDTFYTLTITTQTAPADPGSTLASALNLGAQSAGAALTHDDWVGNADGLDVYRFTISSIRDVTLTVGSGATVQLVDDYNGNLQVDSGEVITQVSQGSLHQRLAAGNYYALVSPYYSSDTFYTLTIVTQTAPADPGSTLATADNLGTPAAGSALTHDDWVGNADGSDIYKFTIPTIRDVTLSVGAGATVQLIDDYNGNLQIDSGDVISQASQGSTHQRLFPGTYYAVVSPYYSSDTFYTLTIASQNAPADPGNSLGAAQDLGSLSGLATLNDWVGTADSIDCYRFSLPVAETISGSITANATLQLVKDVNGNKIVDPGDVFFQVSQAAYSQPLTAGTYYALVTPYYSSDAFYTLTINAPFVQTTTVNVAATDASAAFANDDPGVFTIYRSGSTASALTVDYSLGGTAVNGTDYVLTPKSAVIPAGKTSVTVTITPKTGTAPKPDKTVILTLTATASYGVGTKSMATVTILNDLIPNVGVWAADAQAAETPAGPASTGDFLLSRSGPLGSTQVISCKLAGSAVYGVDYTLTAYGATLAYNKTTQTLTITIAAATPVASIIVTPTNDKLATSTVNVTLSLISSTAYAALPGKASATVTILAYP